MSFDRLPSLEAPPTTDRSSGYNDDPAFGVLTNTLSTHLFTLTSSITQLTRELALVGTHKDSDELRDRIKHLLDETRQNFIGVTTGVKKVQGWDDPSPSMKYTQNKLRHQLETSLADFQAVQRLSAEKNRQYVAAARQQVRHEDPERYRDEPETNEEVPLVQQQQQQAALTDQAEVEFFQGLIVSREEEIRDIERGVVEVNDLMKDLGAMVHEQGAGIELLSDNVSSAMDSYRGADAELRTADRSQQLARRRGFCLTMIMVVVVLVIVLAVLIG